MFLTITAQILGVFGLVLNILAVQFNKYRTVIMMKSLSCFLFIVQYALIGAYVGLVMDAIGLVRNIVFSERIKKGKPMKLCIGIFAAIICIAGAVTMIFSWDTTILKMARWSTNTTVITIIAVAVSIVSIVAKFLTTVGYGIESPHAIRMINLPSSSCWVIYNIACFSPTGVINELLCIVSILIAEFRFRKELKAEKAAKRAAQTNLITTTDENVSTEKKSS